MGRHVDTQDQLLFSIDVVELFYLWCRSALHDTADWRVSFFSVVVVTFLPLSAGVPSADITFALYLYANLFVLYYTLYCWYIYDIWTVY